MKPALGGVRQTRVKGWQRFWVAMNNYVRRVKSLAIEVAREIRALICPIPSDGG
jgi:hypothetical protein